MATFGEVVRREREARGLTQAYLAQQIGATSQTILNIENGKTRTLKTGKLPALAAALEIPVETIVALANGADVPLDQLRHVRPLSATPAASTTASATAQRSNPQLEAACDQLRAMGGDPLAEILAAIQRRTKRPGNLDVKLKVAARKQTR